MKKEDKALIIAHIGEQLKEYSCVYLTQTSGLNAEKTSKLRRACFGADVKMFLCEEHSLLRKAFEASETDYSGLYDLLHGETTLLLSNVGNAPAKLIKQFREKSDTLPMLKGSLRGGIRIHWRGAVGGPREYQEQERTYRRRCGSAAVAC